MRVTHFIWAAVPLSAAAAVAAVAAGNSGIAPGVPAFVRTSVAAWLRRDEPLPSAMPARHAVKVEAVAARSGDVPITLSGIGTVQALNTVAVRSRIDGEITAVPFREGQDVQAGATMAVIDPRPLQAQLDEQEANLQKDQALLDGATLDLQRYESLVTKSFATQQQVDQQRALVAQDRAQVKVDAAQLAFAHTQLGYTTVTSPIAGRTGVRMIDAGNYVRAGDNTPIVVVTQMQPISVIFTLPATSVAESRLTPGEVQVPVDAYAADGRTLLDHGTVDLVDNLVDQATGTIKLKATFPNAAMRLWPGSFVEGRLTVDIRHNAVTVPEAAVRHGPRTDFVFFIGPDRVAKIRDISVGQESQGRVLVEKGLDPGDLVVTEGQLRLENGTPVEVVVAGDKAVKPEDGGHKPLAGAPDGTRQKARRHRDAG